MISMRARERERGKRLKEKQTLFGICFTYSTHLSAIIILLAFVAVIVGRDLKFGLEILLIVHFGFYIEYYSFF